MTLVGFLASKYEQHKGSYVGVAEVYQAIKKAGFPDPKGIEQHRQLFKAVPRRHALPVKQADGKFYYRDIREKEINDA